MKKEFELCHREIADLANCLLSVGHAWVDDRPLRRADIKEDVMTAWEMAGRPSEPPLPYALAMAEKHLQIMMLEGFVFEDADRCLALTQSGMLVFMMMETARNLMGPGSWEADEVAIRGHLNRQERRAAKARERGKVQ